jgi:hypothetical protein
MTLRALMNSSRVREHLPGNCEELKPGKETSAHCHDGPEAAPADLLLSPEWPRACAVALTGVRAET